MEASFRRLRAAAPECEQWLADCWLQQAGGGEIANAVAETIAAVAARGDEALIELTERFDGWRPTDAGSLRISSAEIHDTAARLEKGSRAALQAAAERIEDFHSRQKPAGYAVVDEDGNRLERRFSPLDSVAVYVPGGTAAYPSSCLMGALPAKIARVDSITLVTPAKPGELNPWVAQAAMLAGIREGWRIGGAQAIAALALGTSAIQAVDKIVGPGNAYVTEAKRQLSGRVGIDLLAGPSELIVVGDGTAPCAWTAADLIAQAEHGPDSKVALISTSAAELDEVADCMRTQAASAERSEHVAPALSNAALIEAGNLDEAFALANRIAPEHLQLSTAGARSDAGRDWTCGALFVGARSSVPLGDYCAGTNHVLPTGGSARFASGLSVCDFIRSYSVVEVSEAGAGKLGHVAADIAVGEGLFGHADAIRMRGS